MSFIHSNPYICQSVGLSYLIWLAKYLRKSSLIGYDPIRSVVSRAIPPSVHPSASTLKEIHIHAHGGSYPIGNTTSAARRPSNPPSPSLLHRPRHQPQSDFLPLHIIPLHPRVLPGNPPQRSRTRPRHYMRVFIRTYHRSWSWATLVRENSRAVRRDSRRDRRNWGGGCGCSV